MLQKGAIQLPLFVIVYPSLMLAYLGQGAKLITGGDKVLPNIFYLSIPGGSGSPTYWIGFVLGILATIIASQAMLSASFSIVSQLSHLRSFPSVGMKHTDEAQIGQIYIPVVNYALGIAIVGVVAGFKTSTGLTSAYGLAVMSVAFITTVSKNSIAEEICLDLAADVFLFSFLRGSFAQTEVALQIYFVKNRPWILAILFLAFFGFIDGLLWGATLRKVVLGAWFSLSVGVASEFSRLVQS